MVLELTFIEIHGILLVLKLLLLLDFFQHRRMLKALNTTIIAPTLSANALRM